MQLPRGAFLAGLLVALGAFGVSCRSTNHSGAKTNSIEDVAAVKTPGAKDGKDVCQAEPEQKVCCAALIPSCNDCRAENKKRLEEWRTKCLAPAKAEPDCTKTPVVDCSGDDSEEAEACRQDAVNALLAWKERCANFEAHPCNAQPPLSICCQALTPSCDSCRARNQRVVEEWERRCAPGDGKAGSSQ